MSPSNDGNALSSACCGEPAEKKKREVPPVIFLALATALIPLAGDRP